ncbi:tumor necrosis factor receptor superfamily member 18 [Eublepharis macularius]|uniref:Tumor necrosis factor receptor superfamily member 18 n=1 Tax=Eublepharis macularius TaxID=481883 RepID=A0AA97KKF5_EUBMA|nr:tumor necrosis factor receptor superfamily member 18 [Eublepharis macularius]
MAAVTKGLETRLLYFAVLWLCGELREAAQDGLPPVIGYGGKVCCTEGISKPCCDVLASKEDCLGKVCSNPRCDKCRPVPKCKEGEELQCSGTIDFEYFCQECPYGTYWDKKIGCCIAWTDCNRNGFQTLWQGNRTHNAQCGFDLLTVETDDVFANVLAILTAAGIVLVILLMVFLLFCMWGQKRGKLPVMEDPEAVGTSNLLHLPQQHEDSFSCQYPEEECGHKMAEGKASTLFLAH